MCIIGPHSAIPKIHRQKDDDSYRLPTARMLNDVGTKVITETHRQHKVISEETTQDVHSDCSYSEQEQEEKCYGVCWLQTRCRRADEWKK